MAATSLQMLQSTNENYCQWFLSISHISKKKQTEIYPDDIDFKILFLVFLCLWSEQKQDFFCTVAFLTLGLQSASKWRPPILHTAHLAQKQKNIHNTQKHSQAVSLFQTFWGSPGRHHEEV